MAPKKKLPPGFKPFTAKPKPGAKPAAKPKPGKKK